MVRKSTLLITACSLLALLLSGCSVKETDKSDESLNVGTILPVEEEYLDSLNFQDDGQFARVAESIQQSIRYFESLPEDVIFSYGELQYSPNELVLSMQLFLEMIQKHKGEEINEVIRRKFHVLESKNSSEGAFFTGYYEPILKGSLARSEHFPTPLYSRPNDLIVLDLGLFNKEWENKTIIGRVEGSRFVPYDSRMEIAYQASLSNRATPLAYVENEIELFFLQIQGSGLIQLEDGSLLRVGYAGQNGHAYRPIGRLLFDEIPPEEMSMQAIKDYLYKYPKKVKRILSFNPSYIFFRQLEKEGPLGVIEVPLTAGRSLAMDRGLAPLGGLAFIETTYPVFKDEQVDDWIPLRRFMVIQDTGGAIKGHGRADIFWGNQKGADLIAGHMKQEGRIFILVARKEYLQPVRLSKNTR